MACINWAVVAIAIKDDAKPVLKHWLHLDYATKELNPRLPLATTATVAIKAAD